MVQIALFITATLSFILGIFVLLNNPRSTLFRLYFALSLSSAIWMVANGLVVNQPLQLDSSALLSVGRLITPSSLVTVLSLFFFLKVYQKITLNILDWVLLLSIASVSAFSLTNANVYLNSQNDLALGKLYPLYLLTLVFTVGLIFVTLYDKRDQEASLDISTKLQLRYLKIGTFGAIVPAIILGSLLPLVSSTSLSNVGPLFSIVFLVCAAFAIVKHHLFDVRLVVARSLAYLFSLGVLAGVFAITTFGITNVFFSNAQVSSQWLRAVYTFLAVVLAFIFPAIKTFFDKSTNRIFYRDAYDPQIFMNELNRTIIDNIELGILLRRAAGVIKKNLKCDPLLFAIFDEANDRMRFIDDSGVADITYYPVLLQLINQIETKIVMDEDVLKANLEEKSKNVMRDNNISIVARLNTDNKTKKKFTNLLIIGPKQSGNPFDSQDLRIIEIIVNELIISIQNALRFEEIQKFNSTLQEKIDQATKKLRTVNEKLRTLDEAKDDFISMASHQLRTPLTSAKGYISMVLEGDTGEITPQQHKLLAQAYSSSQRMVYIIADLLNVSRLRTGKFIMEPNPINLADVVEEEVNQLKETAEVHEVELSYEKPAEFPTLMLDETKTRQVVMNYIDNAIYYTPPNGKINVSLKDNGTTIEFKVIDNGIGVPASEKHHLFSKFYRAGNARKARPDGTGLGLFMAKKVIIAQGGAIIFDSAEGKGSTFGFIMSKTKHLPSENTND